MVFTGNTKKTEKGDYKIEVKCDCSKTLFVYKNKILRGIVKTCGCLRYRNNNGHTGSKKLQSKVLNLANGKCECCQSPAPFLTAPGKPYLEVHHVIPVSCGGWNGKDNMAAICPNCHREIHYGMHGNILAESLYGKVSRLSKMSPTQHKINKTNITKEQTLFDVLQ